jgi:hypothetical protein
LNVRSQLMVQMMNVAPNGLELRMIARLARRIPLAFQLADFRFDPCLVDADDSVMFPSVDAQGLANRRKQVILVHLRIALHRVMLETVGYLTQLGERFLMQFVVRVIHCDLRGARHGRA